LSIDRARGTLVGLACGDALGTSVEFSPRGTFAPVTNLVGGGPFDLDPGQWTDDTSMALCLAESLLECGSFEAVDQLRRYVRWFRHGHLSSTDRCFDIGNTTRRALMEFERTGNPRSGPTDRASAGNGSIMRLAPVVLAYHPDRERVRAFSAESSRTTHGAPEAVDACTILADILSSLLAGVPKESAVLVDPPDSASPRLQDIAAGTYRGADENVVRGTGYVVDCLEAALWSFWNAGTFEEAVLGAVNLGDDADTTGAVCGQIAGACWGYEAIPERWRPRLAMHDLIVAMADGLWAGRF
jgi:ADP-ribosyl-[dinitrogen reductase] hydrolase